MGAIYILEGLLIYLYGFDQIHHIFMLSMVVMNLP